ncbi:MAG TPA: NDP-sugar synthase [Polyangia bacterium]|nr:NDP-sugar synthase [Polyangia bacterium]
MAYHEPAMSPSNDLTTSVMLLAAGRSTRLGALGLALPKPLVPICGYPAITYGLAAAARAGARRAVVNVFHRGDLVRAALGDGRTLGVSIDYSVEADLLGTGGGIAAARTRLGTGPALVMNAKVVADLDLLALLAAHAGHEASATMLLRDDPEPQRWGAIGVDATGRVVSILDARSPRPAAGPVTLRMFTGVQVLAPALMDRLQPIFSDLIRDAYVPALREGETIRAVTLPGYFAEHSTPARYLEGNLALLRAPDLLRGAPGPLVGVDPAARVAAGARIVGPVRIAAGAEIDAGAEVGPEVVVDAGARVAAGARLRRTVVWSGAVATGEISDAVVTPTGVVAVESAA